MPSKLAVLLAATMILSTACSGPPPSAPVVSTGCAWAEAIYPPASERAVLLRDAPVTARAIARHNAAVETCNP